MSTPRWGHTATLLNDGRVLVAGGFYGTSLASAELYDPATGTWSSTRSMLTPRHGHTAARLADGRVLIAGGEWWLDGTHVYILASAELYNPATATWSSTGSMGAQHDEHTATLLLDGRVLVAGGSGGTVSVSRVLNSAGVFNLATETWSFVDSLYPPRTIHTATRLADGRVMVAGGYDDNLEPIALAEADDSKSRRLSARRDSQRQ